MSEQAKEIYVSNAGGILENLGGFLRAIRAGNPLVGGADAWFFNEVGHWICGTYIGWKTQNIDGDEVTVAIFENATAHGVVPFGEDNAERDDQTGLPVGLTDLEHVSVKVTLTAYSKNFLDDMKEGERYLYIIAGIGEKKDRRKEAPYIVQCYPLAANAPMPTFHNPNAPLQTDAGTGEVRTAPVALPPVNATTAGVRDAQTPRRDALPGEHVDTNRTRRSRRGQGTAEPRNVETNPEGYAQNF